MKKIIISTLCFILFSMSFLNIKTLNNKQDLLFIHPEEIEKEFPIPAAFEKYVKYVNVKIGQDKYEE